MANAFVNSFAVSIPATVIPILAAAFAAYAFAWMRFPGREVLFVILIGLLVVPLQVAFIPLLRDVFGPLGLVGEFPAVWLAHAGFGHAALPSTCCATTWAPCHARCWSPPASTAPATSRSSGG